MTRASSVTLVACIWAVFGSTHILAQAGDTFSARLSVVPIDARAAQTTSGIGTVRAVLVENSLFMTGSFEGMSSAAIAAHVHQGRAGQRGSIAFQLTVSKGSSGVLGGSVHLTGEEVQTLLESSYYIQIHTEGNPGGELRGWILASE
ncbi:uncharacterized protein METZ01_LOCUS127874 [marine metagenome]|uniref:CHRD domain-containing protein n=1 Tax=marine metagenome TaxID=408172 RepID=A0A381YDQ4_9ZZZZ